MSRPQLIKQLKIKHPNLNKSQLEIIVDTFFNTIADAIKEGKNCQIRGFGNFYLRHLKENHNSRNPSTGQLIYKPKRNKVGFRASKNFKAYLNK